MNYYCINCLWSSTKIKGESGWVVNICNNPLRLDISRPWIIHEKHECFKNKDFENVRVDK
jgi:hypothetical protein